MTHHFDSARPSLAHELIYRDARRKAALLKAQHKAQPLTAPKRLVSNVPLLPAPKIAGLLPAPGHTSSPYTNPRDRLMIGGKVYAVGEGYVMAEIEDAIAAQRKALKLGLFQRAHELVEQTAEFSYHGSVPTRNGRRGSVIRRLTDGRYVVKIDCPLLYWEFYSQAELRALVDKSAGVKAAA